MNTNILKPKNPKTIIQNLNLEYLYSPFALINLFPKEHGIEILVNYLGHHT